MSRKTVALGILLITLLTVSILATIRFLDNVNSNMEFFVGVEFAYSDNIDDLKDLVDKVKNYTNLFVIGALGISFNQTILNESCDYIVNAGLHFVVLFTDSTRYSYDIFTWITNAKQKYAGKFLSLYRFDEPGGHQIDNGNNMIVKNATDYADAAAKYVGNWSLHLNYYFNFIDEIVTADYALYWFDYKAGYSTVLAEFGWNHSRTLHIGLCRGAAKAHNKDWGAIITWEYDDAPYIESAERLYEDMILAYKNGAKYIVVFSYPKIGQYGVLTEEHFNALKNFWNYIHVNSHDHGVIQGKMAYVLPQDYGFGFRKPDDKIWGLWDADALSSKVWADINTLLAQYDLYLDIIYDEAETMDAAKSHYDKLLFWNETV
ncbi:MAG: hypothetical protein QXV09_04635 [Candidatus Bathyarchaeia archaeon]